jgi:CIC family chloride channel protein
LFATESLAQALRQLMIYGRDGLPVLSADGQHIQGWITNPGVLQAVARQIRTSRLQTTRGQLAADWALPDPQVSLREPPTPLPGYQILEVTLRDDFPAAGSTLSAITWPPGWTPISILHDRINLLVPGPRQPDPPLGTPRSPDSPSGPEPPVPTAGDPP